MKIRLNDGLLPADYYAQVEQVAGEITTDVLTLQTDSGEYPEQEQHKGSIAVDIAPPQVEITASLEASHYTSRAKRLVVRHSSDDRVVAVIEVVSPGNKATRHAWRRFVDKAVSLILDGRHLLVVDLFPPGNAIPKGSTARLDGVGRRIVQDAPASH